MNKTPMPGPSKPRSKRKPRTKKSNRKAANAERPINKLPPELLLRIFVVGDEEERARETSIPYYGFQDLAVQVCTHWRDLAINSPILWTYIYVSRELPHKSAALYLSRTTPTSLLDIELDMMEAFFDYDEDIWSSKIHRAKKTIDFLIEHGAPINRWKSLIARSGTPQVLYKILEHIHPLSAPSLQFLSLYWRPQGSALRAMEDETESLAYSHIFNNVYPETNDPFPRLRHVQFKSVPINFLLNRPLPVLRDLVHLDLNPGFSALSWPNLCLILSANPRLQSLTINNGIVGGVFIGEHTNTRVVLPELRSLSLSWGSFTSWARDVISIIDAPGIESLTLAGDDSQRESLLGLIAQIAGKDTPPRTIDGDQPSSHRHACPALRTLDISDLSPDEYWTDIPRELFSVLPEVTCLSASGSAFAVLRGPPWLLPHLKHINVSGEPPENLGEILQCRIDGGFSLDIIGVQEQHLASIRDTLPGSITIVQLPNPVEQDYYDSEDEELDDDGFDDFDDFVDSDGFMPEFGYFGNDGLGHGWLSDDDIIGRLERHYLYSDEEEYGGGYDEYDDYDNHEW